MKRERFRRSVGVAAMLALGVASSPRLQAADRTPVELGKGWGSMLACAACAVGAGMTIAGGPGAILIAVNAPGSAVALLACVASCGEALR